MRDGSPSADGATAVSRPSRPSQPSLALDRATWAVGVVAFGLRALWVLAFVRLPSGLSDPILYHGYGLRIASGQGYRSLAGDPTAYYPPGYPYFLGVLYKIADILGLSDVQAHVVGLVQSLLWAVAAVSVVLIGRWAFEGATGRAAGLSGGLVLACWPNLITYAAAWLSETLFVALFSVAVAALTFAVRCARDGPRRWALAVAAVTFAAATMVRPQVLLGLPLVALAWWLGGIGWKRTLAMAAAVCVGVAAFVIPWAMRNDALLGEPVLISTNSGDNLCVGFHPGARGSFEIPAYCDTGEFWNDGYEAELRRNAETRERAWDAIADAPLSLPWLSVRKLWYTYRTDDDGLVANESYGAVEVLSSPWRGLWLTLSHVAYAAIAIAALVGLVLSTARGVRRPRDAAVLALVGLALAGILVPVLFFGDGRFKVPTTPLFALFAGLAVAEALQRRRARHS